MQEFFPHEISPIFFFVKSPIPRPSGENFYRELTASVGPYRQDPELTFHGVGTALHGEGVAKAWYGQ